jgi:hypothetical protein
MVLIRAHDELNSACPFPRSAGESSLRVQLGTPLPLQHGRAGIRCQEQPNLGATSGRAAISAAPARSSHTRLSVWRALTAAAAGWGCGCACPAAGWPAPTTPLTSTPRRTIKRPTIPWPSRWSMTIASAGVTSISGPSDTPRSTRASEISGRFTSWRPTDGTTGMVSFSRTLWPGVSHLEPSLRTV